jgi:alanine dehydrogenase
MIVGVLNESGKIENRAGLSLSGISLLVEYGNTVYVQAGARCVCLSREYFQEEYR